MKKILGAFLFFTTLFGCDNSGNIGPQDDSFFVKYYGGLGDQQGVDLLSLDNHIYMLATSTGIQTDSISNLLVVKADLNGNQVWSKSFGTLRAEEAKSLSSDNDGNLYIAGNSRYDNGNHSILVLKINQNGEELVRREVYEGVSADASNEEVSQIVVNDNQEVLLAGFTSVNAGVGSNENDFYFPRILSDLSDTPNFPNVKIRTLDGDEKLTGVLSIEADRYILVGSSNKPETGVPLGTYQMHKFTYFNGQAELFPGSSANQTNHFSAGVAKRNDTDALAIGNFENSGRSELFISRFPLLNEATTIETLSLNTGLNVTGKSVYRFEDQYILTGKVQNNDQTDILLASLNGFGNINWIQQFGGDQEDSPGNAIQLNNFLYTVGTIMLEKQDKVCLIKTNLSGQLK